MFLFKKNWWKSKEHIIKRKFCLQNFFKKSKLDPQFSPKVSKFSKNGHFAPKMAKIAKSTKIKQIFYVNFERFKMVFWKIFQRRKIFILVFFSHFLLFFCFMNIQKAQKMKRKMRIFTSSKRGLCQKCWICCKNSTNVAKKFSNNSLVPGLFPNFFSGCYINIFKRKTSGNMSN